MAGWEDSWSGNASHITKHEDLELVSNLFGNIFSVFNYMPFFFALISTWGAFATGCDEETGDHVSEDSD